MAAGGRAVAIAVIANLIGGTSYVATKIGLTGLTETTLVVVRTIVALAVLIPASRGRLVGVLRASPRDRRHLVTMGVVGYAIPLILGSYGLRRSTATNAALLIGIEPLSVVLLGTLVLGETLGPRRIVAIVLGLVGATVVVTNGIPLVGVRYTPHVVGDLLLIAHGAAWGVYTVAAKRLLERHDAIAVSTASLVVALPVLVPVAALEATTFAWDATRLPPALAAAILLGLVVSAGMTVLWNTALRDLDASRMAGFIFLQPLSGTAVAAIALGEPVTFYALAGGALIVGGVYVVASEKPSQSG